MFPTSWITRSFTDRHVLGDAGHERNPFPDPFLCHSSFRKGEHRSPRTGDKEPTGAGFSVKQDRRRRGRLQRVHRRGSPDNRIHLPIETGTSCQLMRIDWRVVAVWFHRHRTARSSSTEHADGYLIATAIDKCSPWMSQTIHRWILIIWVIIIHYNFISIFHFMRLLGMSSVPFWHNQCLVFVHG